MIRNRKGKRFCIDDPFGVKTFFYKLCKRFRIREMTDFSIKLQPILIKSFHEKFNKEASVEAQEDTYLQEEFLAAAYLCSLILR